MVILPLAGYISFIAGLSLRWLGLGGPFFGLIAAGLILAWSLYSMILLALFKHSRKNFAGIFLITAIVGISACVFAGRYGIGEREREISRALEAGLREDCLRLIEQWPNQEKQRIFPGDPEYALLPASIRMLDPVYVTYEAWPEYTLPNIGICKNGFAGFAMGIRVFPNEDGVREGSGTNMFGRYVRRRMAPNVYLWMDPT